MWASWGVGFCLSPLIRQVPTGDADVMVAARDDGDPDVVPRSIPRSLGGNKLRPLLFEFAWLVLAVATGVPLIVEGWNAPAGAAYFGIPNAVAVGTIALGFIAITGAVIGLALGLRRLLASH